MAYFKNMLKLSNINFSKLLLYLVIFFSLWRLAFIWFPDKYVFDEVYHGFTAKEYLKWVDTPWVWWTTPPPGVAYEWTHPPLAKEIMSLSMLVLQNQSPWAWRVPGVIISWLGILMVYLIAKQLFDKQNKQLSIIGLLAALIFSLDGLSFVQARTGMNDAYLVAFLLTAIYFSLKRQWLLTSIIYGLALATKWTAIYLLPLLGMIAIYNYISYLSTNQLLNPVLTNLTKPHKWTVNKLFGEFFEILIKNNDLLRLAYLWISILIYILSYLPLFLLGHDFKTFFQLQQQMWWYHTNLEASHDYASAWWSWPFNLYPVWYYVQYHTNGWISNIFASGNLAVFLFGFTAVVMSAIQLMRRYHFGLLLVVLGYLSFIMPWALSPRIMFLYHYSPCLPFLAIALAYQLHQLWQNPASRQVSYIILGILIGGFILTYPFLAGIPLPPGLMQLFFWTNFTKNPFIPS